MTPESLIKPNVYHKRIIVLMQQGHKDYNPKIKILTCRYRYIVEREKERKRKIIICIAVTERIRPIEIKK